MTAREYLEQDSEYSPLPGTYILYVQGETLPFIHNNKIYCTGSFRENNIQWGFFKTKDYDGRIIYGLSNAIDYQVKHRKEFKSIISRLNRFFENMIECAELANTNSELINLRINVNLIYNLSLSAEQKTQWADWIKELYWNRKKLLNSWYIEYVLPF